MLALQPGQNTRVHAGCTAPEQSSAPCHAELVRRPSKLALQAGRDGIFAPVQFGLHSLRAHRAHQSHVLSSSRTSPHAPSTFTSFSPRPTSFPLKKPVRYDSFQF